jgi:hypothetical protein
MSTKSQLFLVISVFITSIALLLASFSYMFGQYVRVREHNLNVLSEVRLCANEELVDCVGAAVRQKIRLWE